MTSQLPYRPCVAVMLFNKTGWVFVAKRIDQTAEAWQMPQGGVDEGEDPKSAVMRELQEEIGTNNVEIIRELDEWITYDLPEELIPQIWGGKFRGQKQKWFAMRFLGEDSEINIQTAHPEFSAWKWAERHTLPDLIVPFKRELYKHVVEKFKEL
jgi:putative (di)nucleoside polyphosphate hydrolase